MWQKYLAATALMGLSTAFAQSGPIPEYLADVPEFSVLQVQAAGAPSIRSVTPQEWITADPANTGLNAVLTAWNGGAKSTGSKLFVHGGGHNDSANNGVYIYDFAGTSQTEGWTLGPISSVSAVQANQDTYSDGLPTSVHTYDGLIFSSHNNHIYRFGGSKYNNGFMTNTAFKFNVSNGVWTQLPDFPGSGGGAKTMYDPGTGNLFVSMQGTFGGYFLRTDSDSWSSEKNYGGNGFPYNSTAVFDPTRNRGLVIGAGERSLLEINFSNEQISLSDFSASGADGILDRSGISSFYDQALDVYWIFGGPTNSSGWQNLYSLNADGPPWVVTSYSLSGDNISPIQGMIGSWGRFVYMPAWRAIGVVTDIDEGVYVIKLPGELPPQPESMNLQIIN